MEAFKKKKYMAAYKHFFEFLKDPEVPNVHYKAKRNGIDFEIIQGSKLITGKITKEKIVAETNVVIAPNP